MILVASVILSFAISTSMMLISSLNYPGGSAVSFLEKLISEQNEGVYGLTMNVDSRKTDL